jgi:hypothetical protein
MGFSLLFFKPDVLLRHKNKKYRALTKDGDLQKRFPARPSAESPSPMRETALHAEKMSRRGPWDRWTDSQSRSPRAQTARDL